MSDQIIEQAALNLLSFTINTAVDSFRDVFNIDEIAKSIDSFERYFAFPNANTAINPLNILNASDSPIPTPADSRAGQSQVNRLAAVQETSRTIIARRDGAREHDIPIAFSNTAWSEPAAAYAPQYPHNHVRAYARGMVEEMDDTPNNTRYHLYHPSGSFTEIDNHGTRVQKVTGDHYEILCQNNSVYIKGRCNLTVEGDCNIKVMNSVHMEVDGETNVLSKNDVNVFTYGNAYVSAKENLTLKSEKMLFEAKQLDINIEEAINVKGKSLSATIEEAIAVKGKNLSAQIEEAINLKGKSLSAAIENALTLKGQNVAIDSQSLVLKGNDVNVQAPSFNVIASSIDLGNATLSAGPSAAERLIDTNRDTLVKPALFAMSPGSATAKSIPAMPEMPEIAEVRKTEKLLPQGSRGYPSQPEFPHTPRHDRITSYAINNDEPNGNAAPSYNRNATMGSPTGYNIGDQDVAVTGSGGSSSAVDASELLHRTNIPGSTVLSKHCTLADVTMNPAVSHYYLKAQVGLTEGQIAGNLKNLCVNVIDKIFDRYGKGNVIITSAFRYPQDNPTSQHPKGQAVDLQFRDIPKSEYAKRAAEIAGWLDFDQLLFEYCSSGSTLSPWVHISYNPSGNRKQYATIDTANNRFQSGRIINPFAKQDEHVAPKTPEGKPAQTDGVVTRPATDVTSIT